jgi:hypothetical protein
MQLMQKERLDEHAGLRQLQQKSEILSLAYRNGLIGSV